MNIFLWVLQALLALHTITGAIWKFSNSPEQTMPSLSALSGNSWLTLSIFEVICAVFLILPAVAKFLPSFNNIWTILVPIASIGIILEMLLFTGVHIYTGTKDYTPVIYWLVVAGICAFVAYGRIALRPL